MTKSILRDVAAVAGVSLRTASRVLNDDPRVAVDTRARVQQAMRDLKYTPDSMARSLRAGTDTAVGMVVESVADPFFSAMVAAVEKAESTHGKSVLVASTHGDAARERDVVAQMLSRRICGMLLAPTTGDHAWLHTNTPLVLGRPRSSRPRRRRRRHRRRSRRGRRRRPPRRARPPSDRVHQ